MGQTRPDDERPAGPDERPAADQKPVEQELDGIRYLLPMRLEAGIRGLVEVKWRDDGEVFLVVRGAAVLVEDRIRKGRKER